MVDGGYLAAGYQYIIIDDCWLNHSRAAVSSMKIFYLKNNRLIDIGWFITT
jgi:Alpha galactosidase A